jgi:hypothetical protein
MPTTDIELTLALLQAQSFTQTRQSRMAERNIFLFAVKINDRGLTYLKHLNFTSLLVDVGRRPRIEETYKKTRRRRFFLAAFFYLSNMQKHHEF